MSEKIKMLDIYFSEIINKMSVIEKLNFLLSKNGLLDEFLELRYNIIKNLWCLSREQHKPTWCQWCLFYDKIFKSSYWKQWKGHFYWWKKNFFFRNSMLKKWRCFCKIIRIIVLVINFLGFIFDGWFFLGSEDGLLEILY